MSPRRGATSPVRRQSTSQGRPGGRPTMQELWPDSSSTERRGTSISLGRLREGEQNGPCQSLVGAVPSSWSGSDRASRRGVVVQTFAEKHCGVTCSFSPAHRRFHRVLCEPCEIALLGQCHPTQVLGGATEGTHLQSGELRLCGCLRPAWTAVRARRVVVVCEHHGAGRLRGGIHSVSGL